ncbi:MAG: hypothetical protein ACTSP4_02325 [Candidatus Hodarchaeales archaeon]
MVSTDLFNMIVLDTNFFINLEEAGIKELLPKLTKILKPLKVSCSVPAELPKSDVPSAFRQLRHKIPKYIPMVNVSRNSKFWQKCAEVAHKRRMVNYHKDPGDIDVVVLAKMHQKKGKKVAVVSDDQGVVRIVQELKPFAEIEALSSGAFLATLSATVDNPELREIIDKGAKNVFRKSWSYKKKTRQYIDIDLLVEDLADTALFVRSASETLRKNKMAEIQSKAATVTKDATVIKDEPIRIDSIEDLFKIFQKMRDLREANNLVEAEAYVYKLPKMTANLVNESEGAEEKIIITQLIFSELFEHRSWCLNYRMKREGLVEAHSHSEAIISLLPFLNVGEEVVENILALHSLMLFLLGRYETGYNVVSQIPITGEISHSQLLSLIIARIALNKADEAKKLLDDNIKTVDIDGFIESIHKYANRCFTRNREELAIDLLKFLLNCFPQEKKLLEEPAEKLFMISRLSPHKIEENTLKAIQKILGSKSKDDSKKNIPNSWKKTPFVIDPDHPVRGLFSETYTILKMNLPPDREEIHVIAWGDRTNSLWKIVMSLDMKPALEQAKSFKLSSGTITKIVRKSPYDLRSIRGSIHVKDPVLQIDLDLPWD